MITDKMNFHQEIEFKSADMKHNYQELIECLNKFYSNKRRKLAVLEPDENDVKQPDSNPVGAERTNYNNVDSKPAVSEESQYGIYLVPSGEYQRAVKGRDASQVNEMIKSGILMNELQLSLNSDHQIKNSEDFTKCYGSCNKCVLYVSDLPRYYLFVKHMHRNISFKWVPAKFNENDGDGSDSDDDIEWEDVYKSFKNDICEKFNLVNNDNLAMNYGKPFAVIAISEIRDYNDCTDVIDDEDELESIWDEIVQLGQGNGNKSHYCAVVNVVGDTIVQHSAVLVQDVAGGDITAELQAGGIVEQIRVFGMLRDEIRSLGLFNDIDNDLLLLAIEKNGNNVSRTIMWGLSFGADYKRAFEQLAIEKGLANEMKEDDSQQHEPEPQDENTTIKMV